MAAFDVSYRMDRKRQKRPRLRLLLFLFFVYTAARLVGNPASQNVEYIIFRHKTPPPPPIIPISENADEAAANIQLFHFTGKRVRGNGTYLNLGDRHTSLPGSLLARFFPDELVAPSCLTQPPPRLPAPGQPASKKLPIRDDWPGFYGAPWTAWADSNLIALLHVYAPRHAALPVGAPQFEIYAGYNVRQTIPTFGTTAPATFTRGSKAVLYRVFANGPVRCLDLVVQNGENNGTGHLYYKKYHHYYEMDTTFQIQP